MYGDQPNSQVKPIYGQPLESAEFDTMDYLAKVDTNQDGLATLQEHLDYFRNYVLMENYSS